MTRPASTTADRGAYIGLLRDAPQGAIWRPQATFRIGSRLDIPLAPHERLTADGDRISVCQNQREA